MKPLARIIYGFGNSALQAVVLVDLWRWFVVPQFGLAPLRFWMAAGLTTVPSILLSSFFIHLESNSWDENGKKKESELRKWIAVTLCTFAYLLTWGYAYIVHLAAK